MEYKTIFEAIEADDIEAVKTFLPEHANDRSKNNYTPLYLSIICECKEIFDLLLDNSVNLYCLYDSDSGTILYELWEHNWTDKIQKVVEHGVDINSRTGSGKANSTVLYFVCRSCAGSSPKFLKQALTFIKELIRCGAETDLKDQYGKPYLDYLPDKVRKEIDAFIVNLKTERQGNIAHKTEFDYEL